MFEISLDARRHRLRFSEHRVCGYFRGSERNVRGTAPAPLTFRGHRRAYPGQESAYASCLGSNFDNDFAASVRV